MDNDQIKGVCVVNKDELSAIAKKVGLSLDRFHTSRDMTVEMQNALSANVLGGKNIIDPQFAEHAPDSSGIRRWVLPFPMVQGSIMVMVQAAPMATVKEHSHDKGLIRTVFSGQMTMTGVPNGPLNLGPGEWVYIPPKQTYGYIAGPNGYLGNCCYCTFK